MQDVTAEITGSEWYEYTHGRCAKLAQAISEITGWPVAVIAPADDYTWETETHWTHAVVLTPGGYCLDITGRTDEYELLWRWECDEDAWQVDQTERIELQLVPVDREQWVTFGFNPPEDRDRDVARRVLQQYTISLMREALSKLDGTVATAIAQITGLSVRAVEELGGLPRSSP